MGKTDKMDKMDKTDKIMWNQWYLLNRSDRWRYSRLLYGGTASFIAHGIDGNTDAPVWPNPQMAVSCCCDDGSQAWFRNGQDGTDGDDGETGANGTNGDDGTSCVPPVSMVGHG